MKTLFLLLSYLFFILSGSPADAQTGKVGINTATPQAAFHVADSSVVFTGPLTMPVIPGSPPITGPGVRMMWYPDKAAFRAGRAFNDLWDKDKVGLYSVAFGYVTQATGEGSFAIGNSSSAPGNYAIAMGSGNSARGASSLALGFSNVTRGDHAVAFGQSTDANGKLSISTGLGTISRPYASLVIGSYNDSVISSSPTVWNESDPVFIVGNGTSNTDRSNSFLILKNGKTGINNSSPKSLLHVSSLGTTGVMPHSDAVIVAERSGDDAFISVLSDIDQTSGITFGNSLNATDGGIYYNTGGNTYDLRFRTNGNVSRMTIDSVGSVGIGTTAPAYGLHVVNNLGPDGFTRGIVVDATSSGTTGEAAISFKTAGAGGTGPKYWIVGLNQGRNLNFGYGIQFNAGSTLMTLDSIGRLGIGFTNPTQTLDVAGNMRATGNLMLTSGRVNRTSSGSADLLPICYGSINSVGVDIGGTSNFTSTKTATGVYEIAITGESYSSGSFFTSVTPINGSNARTATTSVSGTSLVVRIFDASSGVPIDNAFHFIIFKL